MTILLNLLNEVARWEETISVVAVALELIELMIWHMHSIFHGHFLPYLLFFTLPAVLYLTCCSLPAVLLYFTLPAVLYPTCCSLIWACMGLCIHMCVCTHGCACICVCIFVYGWRDILYKT